MLQKLINNAKIIGDKIIQHDTEVGYLACSDRNNLLVVFDDLLLNNHSVEYKYESIDFLQKLEEFVSEDGNDVSKEFYYFYAGAIDFVDKVFLGGKEFSQKQLVKYINWLYLSGDVPTSVEIKQKKLVAEGPNHSYVLAALLDEE